MATTVTSTSNYSGKVAGEIVAKMYKEVNTLADGLITLNENVNFKLNLRLIETTGGRRAYTCGFLPAGSIVLNEKVLEPIKFKDDFEICKEDFRNQWNDGDLGESAWNDGNMKPILDAILADKLAQEAEAIEEMIWQGTGTGNEWLGFIPQFKLDVDVVDVAGVAITKANVLAELEKVVTAIPQSMKNKPNVRIMVSPDVAEKYNFNLVGQGIVNGLGGNANTAPTFGRYQLHVVMGLPDNTMVVAEPKNLILATGSKADFNDIRLVDSDATHLDGKIIGSMVYNGAVGYYYGSEVVLYSAGE